MDLNKINQYLDDSLEADEKVAEWQVKQAADTVITYKGAWSLSLITSLAIKQLPILMANMGVNLETG
ncbi:MAG: hypothetical protein NT010_06860 [Proteobacteria bacterium]|nr:hypothetical protein [Pseudomonadota bacterium]